ncbi:glycosyltransferase [Nibricoccus sp. IMCC34717]|uniref:glycosyltransferase n=1 Tax=Nibricoccus sp. IMCC34717 TaxID=3034021 RepID=UPI0038513EA7
MKILILQDHLRSGGTERQTLFLAASFRERGHDARILTFRPGGVLAQGTTLPPVEALQPFDTGLDWFAPGLVRRVRSLAPDLVLAMGRMANCHAGGLQRRLPAVPVVSTVRTGKPLPWLFRRSLRLTRAVVCNSRETAARLEAAGLCAAAQLQVIHNALVFTPRIQAPGAREATRQALRVQPGNVVLLNVGVFRPEKNQRVLIEAAAKLPGHLPWLLWLVGDGPERAACEALATRLGVRGRMRFTGHQADPRAYYEAADLAVHTSLRESLSNFLCEAQAHGLPVVAWDALGVSETLRPGESGVVVPSGDTDAFVRELAELAGDEPRRANMGAAARAHAKAAFSPDAQVEAYLRLFAQLVENPTA